MAELYYLMGASGAGKDSLLNYVRQRLPGNANTVLAHRYITRPAEAGGENHLALSEEEFARRQRLNCFALHWRSHGNHYGIGIEINQWLAMGLSVVVNGSRAYLDQALLRYPQLVPVLITVTEQRLRARLQARGRESGLQLEQRLQRAALLDQKMRPPGAVRIANDGPLEQAGDKLLSLLGGVSSQQCV
jgi:ribose 1,5-bisphosphokinase